MSTARAADLPQRTTAYKGAVTNTDRWDAFTPRDDDIFICTPDKSGTTWTQAICALLIFGTPGHGKQPAMISPWVDAEMIPLEMMNQMLEAQTHRRFVKTHTPLDGIPYFPQCTYVMVFRDPRDAHLSMRNHILNQKNDVFDDKLKDNASEGFRAWATEPHIEGAREEFNLESIVEFYKSYARFAHLPNMHMFHYADMKRDLKREMTRLAAVLGIVHDDALIDVLVEAASFANMKKNASQFAPAAGMDVWKDESQFFNKGSSQWRDVIAPDDLAIYDERIRTMLPDDEIAWLENGSGV